MSPERCAVRLALGPGSDRAWSVEVPLWLPAGQLARRLLRELEGRQGAGRLMLRGQVLPDGQTLGAAGLEPGSLLRLLRVAPLPDALLGVSPEPDPWGGWQRGGAAALCVGLGLSVALDAAEVDALLAAALGGLLGWFAVHTSPRPAASSLLWALPGLACAAFALPSGWLLAWILALTLGGALAWLGRLGPIPPAPGRREVSCAICGHPVTPNQEAAHHPEGQAHRYCVEALAAAREVSP